MKRLMDLALIVLSVPVWLPLFLVAWILVLLSMGRPAFFRQRRAGLDGKPFDIIKFRTMKEVRDDSGALLPDEERLTPGGQILRSLSLDELPELGNVLRGEMSLVGPRPLPVAYLDRYSPRQARRHECRPGITGWAQVNGRNRVDWEERFEMDVWYVDNRSLLLDLKILWMTLLAVLRREGISAEGSATMREFMGSREQTHTPGPDQSGRGFRDPSRKSE